MLVREGLSQSGWQERFIGRTEGLAGAKTLQKRQLGVIKETQVHWGWSLVSEGQGLWHEMIEGGARPEARAGKPSKGLLIFVQIKWKITEGFKQVTRPDLNFQASL